MKRILLTLALVLTMTTTANAQLFRRSCSGGSCRTAYSSCYGAYRSGYAYAPTTGYWTSGQCYAESYADKITASRPCLPCQTYSNAESYAETNTETSPCAPTTDAPRYYGAVVESVKPCEPVETSRPEPCEACGEYEPIKTSTGLVYRSCPTGACPLQAATRTVAKTVATLLDRANALRASYGLPALSYDATLTAGSQYQASFCASRGALIHGSGVAEILAQNSQGLETALSQWLNSPAHRALLLSPNFRFGGVAVHRDSTGRVWCAMRFR